MTFDYNTIVKKFCHSTAQHRLFQATLVKNIWMRFCKIVSVFFKHWGCKIISSHQYSCWNEDRMQLKLNLVNFCDVNQWRCVDDIIFQIVFQNMFVDGVNSETLKYYTNIFCQFTIALKICRLVDDFQCMYEFHTMKNKKLLICWW